MEKPSWLRGNDPLPKRINVRSALSRYRKNPLSDFISIQKASEPREMLTSPVDLYEEAYRFYYLSLARFLPEMSLSIRWYRGPLWARREGRKYTSGERKLADRYNQISKFVEYDFYNTILHSRILLDRAIGLTRPLFSGPRQPSFTSFTSHKRFLANRRQEIKAPKTYVSLVCDKTDWFETPLKELRDKFVVHAAPKHLRIFGYPENFQELGLTVIIPTHPRSAAPLADTTMVTVSIPRLARDIEAFLKELNRVLSGQAKC